jgi:hypothetical protein
MAVLTKNVMPDLKEERIHRLAVVVIDDENKEKRMLWVITVCEPNISEWHEGFEKRRKR